MIKPDCDPSPGPDGVRNPDALGRPAKQMSCTASAPPSPPDDRRGTEPPPHPTDLRAQPERVTRASKAQGPERHLRHMAFAPPPARPPSCSAAHRRHGFGLQVSSTGVAIEDITHLGQQHAHDVKLYRNELRLVLTHGARTMDDRFHLAEITSTIRPCVAHARPQRQQHIREASRCNAVRLRGRSQSSCC